MNTFFFLCFVFHHFFAGPPYSADTLNGQPLSHLSFETTVVLSERMSWTKLDIKSY